MTDEIYTVEYVAAIVESAGRTIMMLPAQGTRPTGYKSCLPEHLIEFEDLIGVDVQTKVKYRATLDQMNELSQAQEWISLLARYCRIKRMPQVARAVAYGMLHYPDTEKRVYGWSKLARKMHCSHTAAKSWYEQGIEVLTKLLNQNRPLEKSCSFSKKVLSKS